MNNNERLHPPSHYKDLRAREDEIEHQKKQIIVEENGMLIADLHTLLNILTPNAKTKDTICFLAKMRDTFMDHLENLGGNFKEERLGQKNTPVFNDKPIFPNGGAVW